MSKQKTQNVSSQSTTNFRIDEIEILKEQRNLLLANTKELNKNMFKVIVAVIPLVAAIMVSYVGIINVAYGPIIRFIVLEFVFILSMVISACLFAANINRDYIAAIDSYAFEKYGISVFIYDGKLSMKHLTGMKGTFPLMTMLIGFNAAINILLFALYIIINDLDFYLNNIYLPFLFGIQVIIFLIIIGKNFKRKIKKSSTIVDDCLKYMKRTTDNITI